MPWINYSISLLPEFIQALVIAIVLSSIFTGTFLRTFHNKITWFHVALSAYAGLSLFIILNYLLWYLLDWRFALFLISLIMLIVSTYGWYQAKPRLNLEFSKFFVALAAITILLSFFLFKFTYRNGLHDEYFHYAAIQLFEHTNQYPFIHPYDFEHTLNEVYHVGTYFLVILVNYFPEINLEQALDIAKIVIFLPFPIFLGFSLKQIFSKAPSWLLMWTVLAVLLTGPSWWLRDSYTLWLTQGQDLPQIYMPILYDLAGITWTGVLFWIVFTLGLIIFLTEKPISKLPLILLCVILLSTIIINKAYMLTSFVSLAAILATFLMLKYWSQNNFSKLMMGFVILIVPLTVVLLNNFNDQFPFALFVRDTSDWGYHYASNPLADGIQVSYKYLQLDSSLFLVVFGIAPIVIILTSIFLGKEFKNQHNRLQLFSILFVAFSLLIPIGLYYINDDGLGLALNKLLRPAVFFVALAPIIFHQLGKKWLSYLLLALFIIGAISPVRFFVVNVGEGLQRLWISNNHETIELSNFLLRNNYDKFQALNWGTVYSISNLIPIQGRACITCKNDQSKIIVIPNIAPNPPHYAHLESIFVNQSYIIKEY